jgi:hypothetical protein
MTVKTGEGGSVKGQPVAGPEAENKGTESIRELKTDVANPFKTPTIMMENTAIIPSSL